VVITDDNPRGEDSGDIIHAILSGMQTPSRATVISDRAAAIRHAVATAGAGDVILVAGKGHEDTQQVGTIRLPFSDRTEVERALARPRQRWACHG
jgi:UDP-N-acetylmuramoyl-L-alanyl-D-glutamate--2,6-diaminopimelate ligase